MHVCVEEKGFVCSLYFRPPIHLCVCVILDFVQLPHALSAESQEEKKGAMGKQHTLACDDRE